MKDSRRFLRALVAALVLTGFLGDQVLGQQSSDPISFHLIVVNEVYTNADGTKQFVELMARSDFQTNLGPMRVNALEATGTTTTLVFNFTASFPALSNNETILLATQAVADELGFAPDFLIPPNTISLVDGRVTFATDLGTIVDAVAYGNYTGSNTGFSLPAAALPTDGSASLNRVVYNLMTRDNANDFAVLVNSPRRNDGRSGTLVGVNEQQAIPDAYALHQNFPNPFNPTTAIRFSVPNSSVVTLKVFDLLGKEVATLVNERKSPGTYLVEFDGTHLPSGIYLYRLEAKNFSDTKKVILIK